ncbi:cardiolipin synthase [Bacillus sp. JJ722]|uniref:cardiolipin synthase n=1 Tax=Bacillus sp. JJ722 TaxID=3122973 RepID=UPI0030006767
MFTFLWNFMLVINIILILVMIFLERKEPVYIFAWMFLLIFLPYVGFILYLIFGNGPRFRKRKNFHLKKKWDELYTTYITKQQRQIEVYEGKEEIYRSLMMFNLNANKSFVTTKNKVKIYTKGEDKYHDLFADIRQATDTIHILYYIFNIDEIGSELITILKEKADEGVEVRVVYDDIGSLHTSLSSFQTLINKGGKVYPFFPSKLKILGPNINYRNHRKIVVIDGVIGYTGGMNIGIEYESKDPKLSPWRDTHIRIEGESVEMLQVRFLQDYGYASHEEVSEATLKEKFKKFFPRKDWSYLKEQFIQIVSSGPDTRGEELKNSFIKMIYSAKQSIDIQTPYFVPDSAFLEAIKTAALSKIRVRLMVPLKNDNRYVDRIITSYVKELLEVGVEIYQYEGFIHAKTMTVDDRITTIGTANLDIRSFQLNFEVNAFIYDITTSQEMTAIYEQDIIHSHRVTLEDEANKKWYVRVEESIYRLFSLVM